MTGSFQEFDQSLDSIHREPFAATTGAAAPFTAAQMLAIGEAITDGILAQVLLAVANISIFGVKPFAGLQTWATALETAASNALATANGAQTTANTANTNATTALGNWTTLFTNLGFSVTTATQLATFLGNTWTGVTNTWNDFWNGIFGTSATGKTAADVQTAASSVSSTANTASTNASSALSQWVSSLTASGQASATAFGTFVSSTWSNLTSTWNNFWNGTYGTSATGKTASDVQTAAASTASAAATAGTNASTAISSAASAQTTANTANTSASSQNTWWTQLMSALGISGGSSNGTNTGSAITSAQSTATTAGTNASSALSQWTSYITGLGGAAVSDAVTYVTNTFTQLGNTWNSIWNGTYGTTATGKTASDVQTASAATSSTANTASTNASTAVTNAAAAAATASDAADTAQGSIDATVQAFTNSAATGAAAAAAKASQQAIPVANIAPPPSPSATGIPIHGTSGTGWGNGIVNPSGATSLTVTGSHTKAAADNWIGFWVLSCVTGSGLAAPFNASLSASYGSLNLPVIGQATVLISSSTAWVLSYVGAFIPSSFNPPSAQTCTAQISAGSGHLAYGIAAVSDSYSGVLSVNVPASTPATQGITGSNPAQAGVTSSSADLMVQAFAAVALLASVSLTSYNKTTRANPSLSSMGAAGVALLAGEAAGNTSVSFSATMTSTGDYYGGVAINLVGVGTAPIGSVFKAARISTATVNGSSGANVFPNNFWPTPTQLTADFSWSATTGTLTCLNAGTYTFATGLLEAAIGTPHYARAAIFHNGAVEAQGTTCSVTTTASGLWAVSVSDTFYCNVGDTIQAGAYLSVAVNSVLTGESTGSLTYFSAALANRGTIS